MSSLLQALTDIGGAFGTTDLVYIAKDQGGGIFVDRKADISRFDTRFATATPSYITLALSGTLSAERVLTGTANQIILTDGGANANLTLSTPQDIHTGATPQFARIGLGAAADAAAQISTNGHEAITIKPYGVGLMETGELRFLELAANGTNFTGFKSSDSNTASDIYVLPPAGPVASRFMKSAAVAGGHAILSWAQIDLTTDVTGILPHGNLGPGGGGAVKFLREDSTWQTIPGGGDALTGSPLSQFASTTSAQLAGVISDETGSGALVFATSPSLVMPQLGDATASTLTLPNTGLHLLDTNASHDLIIAPGSDLTADHTLTIVTGDADRTLTLTGAASISGTNTGDVTLAGTPDYITIAGQVITRNKLDPADDLNTFTSSVLETLVTDNTGSGALMFATSPTITTDITIPNTGLHLLDTNATHDLIIAPGSDLTVDRTLTIVTGDADRTLTLSGAATISGTNTGDVTLAGTPDYITIAGQVITRGLIDLTTDVTGILPVANGGTATSTAFTLGSVIFAGAAGVYSQSNATFFWDAGNNRLGIGTNTPSGTLDIHGALAIQALTAATITSDQNDYAPVTDNSFLRLQSDASRTITGIVGSASWDGRLKRVLNFGSFNIVLANESGLSAASNRIITGTGANLTLAPNESVELVYDIVDMRWRVSLRVVSILANPTGTIGLTPVNGTAVTVMRSDAAPALSQAIVPTWTGLHTFTNSSMVVGGSANATNRILMGDLSASDPTANRNTFDFGTTGSTDLNFVRKYATSQMEMASSANIDLVIDSNNNETGAAVTVQTNGTKATGGQTNVFNVFDNGSVTTLDGGALRKLSPIRYLGIVCSDETTAITTGTAKVTFRMPHAMTLISTGVAATTGVRANLNTVSSSGIPTFDINVTGIGSIFSTTLTIDANEKTSTTAVASCVLSTTSIADDAEVTVDFDVAGTGAKGVKIWLIGYVT